MTASRLRSIPSVDRVLVELGDTGLPRKLVVDAVRRSLQALRRKGVVPETDAVVQRLRDELSSLRTSRLRPLINGTGILAHTNFGRAPLGPSVVEHLADVASNYNNLEFSLNDGARGGRAEYLERSLAVLSEGDAATIVNNNAAALVLLVRHFCSADKNEVVISRGELVQIGGGFRIPDILEAAGARLREVGTTNHTSLSDYTKALTRHTALVLKVHRSNFFMEGFVAAPTTAELAVATRKRRVPLVEDLGSGAVFDTREAAGLEREPTPARSLRSGVDAVCFSGDKLLGGPQAGVVAGKARIVAGVKRDPLFRAFRCDKLVLGALESTVDLHLEGGAGVPMVDMLHADAADLRARAVAVIAALDGLPLSARVGVGQSQIGGGALPRSVMSSVTIDLAHDTLSAKALAGRLRSQQVPVVGYVTRGVVKLDLRTIFPRQDALLITALRAASA